ncbi:Undecaprenyl-diphosphatase BcrC [Arthrobacter ulcerisalmonis]|uniref:Undecaprenyl-diphosphatase BcrC n=1 Tax=Arthrobacter ulcerisalmonis TaxID=2483813 RepID=A0A3P5XLN6_9MICC|nr:phosphatase PAP2 family protein [Arthrobacter ulcerisalmonis]VDC29574.1 Undecaprenyl-diphosphatase BcrC [Arthrobacter ulcerisalmonis]
MSAEITSGPKRPLRLPRLPAPRHWLGIGLTLAVLVIAVGFLTRTVPDLTADEMAVDQGFSRHHDPVLTTLALALNLLFGPVGGVAIVAAVGLYLLLVRRSADKAVVFVLTVCTGWLSSQLFKLIIGRVRPDPSLLFDPLVPEPVSNSFPSGHTSLAVAVVLAAFFIAEGTRAAKPLLWAGLVGAGIVAWSRVYIGAHYPLDVVAAFPATIAAVVLMAGLWNRHASGVDLLPRLRRSARNAPRRARIES